MKKELERLHRIEKIMNKFIVEIHNIYNHESEDVEDTLKRVILDVKKNYED